MLAAQLNELGVSQGPEAPPRPNRQHKSPAPVQSSNVSSHLIQPTNNEPNNKQMPQSSSILDQVRRRLSICLIHFYFFYFIFINSHSTVYFIICLSFGISLWVTVNFYFHFDFFYGCCFNFIDSRVCVIHYCYYYHHVCQ